MDEKEKGKKEKKRKKNEKATKRRDKRFRDGIARNIREFSKIVIN